MSAPLAHRAVTADDGQSITLALYREAECLGVLEVSPHVAIDLASDLLNLARRRFGREVTCSEDSR
jgi:hypothetical protein